MFMNMSPDAVEVAREVRIGEEVPVAERIEADAAGAGIGWPAGRVEIDELEIDVALARRDFDEDQAGGRRPFAERGARLGLLGGVEGRKLATVAAVKPDIAT